MRRILSSLLVGVLIATLAAPAEAIQWGAGTGTSYPTTLDTANNRTNVGGAACSSAVTTIICKEWLNDWQGAVIAIMTEMGTLPKGSYADVKTRLNDAAYLSIANVFTTNQTISNTAPSLTLTDTTASAKSLTIAVDANLAQLRESAGASGSLLVLDLANNRVGINRNPTSYPFEVGLSGNGYAFSIHHPDVTYSFYLDGNSAQMGTIQAKDLMFYTANAGRWSISGSSGDLLPVSTGAFSIGSGTYGIKRLYMDYTNTGTIGAVTINKASFRANIALGATSVVVTNSLVTAASKVFCVAAQNDTTGRVTATVPGAGTVTIHSIATTADMAIDCLVVNAD